MAKKRKDIINNSKDAKIEPIIYMSKKAPIETQDILTELLSMRGITKVMIFSSSKEKLYSYERWGKLEKSFEEDDIFDLYKAVQKQLIKIGKKKLDHTIIRSNDSNIVIFNTDKIIAFLQCDKKAKLPLVVIKTKRISEKLASLLK
ncbi:MAG: hypothetical protein FK733_19405 [Asgard group archaeon]|nr:hypothetical protein [Asgard group archaeon]